MSEYRVGVIEEMIRGSVCVGGKGEVVFGVS